MVLVSWFAFSCVYGCGWTDKSGGGVGHEAATGAGDALLLPGQCEIVVPFPGSPFAEGFRGDVPVFDAGIEFQPDETAMVIRFLGGTQTQGARERKDAALEAFELQCGNFYIKRRRRQVIAGTEFPFGYIGRIRYHQCGGAVRPVGVDHEPGDSYLPAFEGFHLIGEFATQRSDRLFDNVFQIQDRPFCKRINFHFGRKPRSSGLV